MIAFGADDERPSAGERGGAGARARLPDHRVRRRRRRVGVRPSATTTRSSTRSSSETLYHVLWELVHVFFDHRGLLEGREARPGSRHRRIQLPLPVPLGVRARPRRGRSTTSASSVLMKAEEVGALREPTLAENRETLIAAAAACASAWTRAGACSPSATAARPPTRWTSSPTSGVRPTAGRRARRARPHRGLLDPHRDRQRRRRRGDLPAPGDRPRSARATLRSRSPPAAARTTSSWRWPRREGAAC